MIDLHCHSVFSDGTDLPQALPHMADEIGLTALALTDHDTVEGIPAFLAEQPKVKTRLLVGTELSCKFIGKTLHVLGLLVDHQDGTFLDRLSDLRNRRDDRNRRLIAKLQQEGFRVEMADVEAQAPDTPGRGSLISRVHFAKALAAKGYVPHHLQAFQGLLNDGGRVWVDREELEPAEASRWIREAGGVPVVAHPGRFGNGTFVWDEAMLELRNQGIEGIEAFYGEYSEIQQRNFTAMAAKLGMVMSGGSDYHGANKPHIRLGRGRGSLKVPDELLEGLEARRREGSWH
ncbi:MAG TPA: PHP domain-containing protein [Holophagaceae bacterium]|nr:PHP domain-containing protein [Holophagaceae bacterium]